MISIQWLIEKIETQKISKTKQLSVKLYILILSF